MFDSRMLGGMLIIIGTSLGAGMIGLPVALAAGGFYNAVFFMFVAWLIMTFSALLILEVNLWLPEESNMISMAHQTLGRVGEAVAWLCYLTLLYTLLSAYTASGTDVLNNLLGLVGIHTAMWVDSVIFILVFGYIIYRGIRVIDYANRFLMFFKFFAYFALLILLAPNVSVEKWSGGQSHALLGAATYMITSFGFATVIPSLRVYFESDVRKLRMAVLVGSLTALCAYLAWIAVILGVLALDGRYGLLRMLTSGHTTSDLNAALKAVLNNPWITDFSRAFTAVCVGTSFLGVSMSLADFLADGLKLPMKHKWHVLVYPIALVPPLLVVLLYPNAFLLGISIAGVICLILLALLPMLMAWRGRYVLQLAHGYRVAGGRAALSVGIVVTLVLIVIGVMMDLGH